MEAKIKRSSGGRKRWAMKGAFGWKEGESGGMEVGFSKRSVL
jgi:hypothetical protein